MFQRPQAVMKLIRFIARVTKGIYDIFATYLLVYVIPFAIVGIGIHFGVDALANSIGWESKELLFRRLHHTSSISELLIRFGIALPVHILAFFLFRRPFRWSLSKLETTFDRVMNVLGRVLERGHLRSIMELSFSLAVTAILVPVVLQPTLVGWNFGAASWFERSVNLADGTAIVGFADSVVGLYRKIGAEPVPAQGSSPDAIEEAFGYIGPDDFGEDTAGPIAPPRPSGTQPFMDRWDPLIRDIARDDKHFAFIKAFMWVESGGRQYAVSRTGCAGLMQFCSGTARDEPYRQIFGTGTVYRCSCPSSGCQIPRSVQRELESGEESALARNASQVPCDLTDARFDPRRSIAAGSLYIERMRKAYGDNIYLMYIGYNSGPAVANRVWRSIGKNANADLDEIAIHLSHAMRPFFGQASEARSRSLLQTHLPKLKQAYDGYLQSVPIATSGAQIQAEFIALHTCGAYNSDREYVELEDLAGNDRAARRVRNGRAL